jgi:hypothetical protein
MQRTAPNIRTLALRYEIFSEISPYDPTISCEDAFDEWSAIMSTKCTGGMNLVPQTRQKDIS